MITPHGTSKGREGIREAWARLLHEFPHPKVDVTAQASEGDLLLMEYTVESDKARITDGVDTLVLSGDGIRRQTVRYSHPAA
jgi:predicted SnoaL-like aldol condensation-catalyzing enzyme